MLFKLMTEDQNTQKGQDFSFEVKPGVEMVAHFYGFAVMMNHEGCVLVLPESIRKDIANMKPGQDRILFNAPDNKDAYDRLLKASLEWYPKDEVEPSNITKQDE